MIITSQRLQVLIQPSLLNEIILHLVLSVITFPTYSPDYHDAAEDWLNISQYFNLTEEFNTTSVPAMEDEEDLPRMTNISLAVALYLACLATVFGNSLVVIAVVKVRSSPVLCRIKISTIKSDSADNDLTGS